MCRAAATWPARERWSWALALVLFLCALLPMLLFYALVRLTSRPRLLFADTSGPARHPIPALQNPHHVPRLRKNGRRRVVAARRSADHPGWGLAAADAPGRAAAGCGTCCAATWPSWGRGPNDRNSCPAWCWPFRITATGSRSNPGSPAWPRSLPADTDLNSVRRKLAYDLFYIGRINFWLDLRLIACTAVHMAGVPYRHLTWLFLIPPLDQVEKVYQNRIGA